MSKVLNKRREWNDDPNSDLVYTDIILTIEEDTNITYLTFEKTWGKAKFNARVEDLIRAMGGSND